METGRKRNRTREQKRNNKSRSAHLYAFLTAEVSAQTLYGDVYLKMKSKK